MDIFEILKEAKKPSPAKKVLRVNTTSSTDYTQDADDNATTDDTATEVETSNDEGNDYTADVEEVEPEDDSTDNEPTDDTSEDPDDESTEDVDNTEGDDTESTDYTDDIDSDNSDTTSEDTDAETSDSTEEVSPEDKLDLQKQSELLNRTVDLYYSITGIVSKLDTIDHLNIVANKINIQVKNNFIDLSDQLYKFITGPFKSNTYIKNLYIYNQFIESYKINIEMLRKISAFE